MARIKGVGTSAHTCEFAVANSQPTPCLAARIGAPPEAFRSGVKPASSHGGMEREDAEGRKAWFFGCWFLSLPKEPAPKKAALKLPLIMKT